MLRFIRYQTTFTKKNTQNFRQQSFRNYRPYRPSAWKTVAAFGAIIGCTTVYLIKKSSAKEDTLVLKPFQSYLLKNAEIFFDNIEKLANDIAVMGLTPPNKPKKLRPLIEKLQQNKNALTTTVCVVIGSTNVGKSTVISRLFCRPHLVYSSCVQATQAPIVIQYEKGQKKDKGILHDEKEFDIPDTETGWSHLYQETVGQQPFSLHISDNTLRNIKSKPLQHWLNSGAVVVDLQGVGQIKESEGEPHRLLLEEIKKASVVILVASLTDGLEEAPRVIFDKIYRSSKKIIVLTMADKCGSSENKEQQIKRIKSQAQQNYKESSFYIVTANSQEHVLPNDQWDNFEKDLGIILLEQLHKVTPVIDALDKAGEVLKELEDIVNGETQERKRSKKILLRLIF